ncbi:MAG: DsbA family oxidoreductase [Bacteroidota bacterium]|nr:DsbA family oxidoreductase [Bacteroidota bacterium]
MTETFSAQKSTHEEKSIPAMTINIWSDIRCPFCYIGKRNFERAVEQFAHKDSVEVIWRSFELDPSLKTQPESDLFGYLAKVKGMSYEESVQMHQHVTDVARGAGLDFNFDKAVVANSYNGHRLIQLAKSLGLGDEAEELLFKAHFTDGRNIDDPQVLLQIGLTIGIPEASVNRLLESDEFSSEVNADKAMASSLGVRGVPFFLINDKFAITGAQPSAVFLQALDKAWKATVFSSS